MNMKPKHFLLAGAFVVAAVAQSSAAVAGDIAAGKAQAEAVCASCHTASGMSQNPIYPNLAGQHESYLKSALMQYREGAKPQPAVTQQTGIAFRRPVRKNAIMAGFAGALTDKQIADLAAYYSSLPGLTTSTSWKD